MNLDEIEIYAGLLTAPGSVYVAPDGSRIYVLVTGGMMSIIPASVSFTGMSEEEINEFIQIALQ